SRPRLRAPSTFVKVASRVWIELAASDEFPVEVTSSGALPHRSLEGDSLARRSVRGRTGRASASLAALPGSDRRGGNEGRREGARGVPGGMGPRAGPGPRRRSEPRGPGCGSRDRGAVPRARGESVRPAAAVALSEVAADAAIERLRAFGPARIIPPA